MPLHSDKVIQMTLNLLDPNFILNQIEECGGLNSGMKGQLDQVLIVNPEKSYALVSHF
jgi:hypothetical protein